MVLVVKDLACALSLGGISNGAVVYSSGGDGSGDSHSDSVRPENKKKRWVVRRTVGEVRRLREALKLQLPRCPPLPALASFSCALGNPLIHREGHTTPPAFPSFQREEGGEQTGDMTLEDNEGVAAASTQLHERRQKSLSSWIFNVSRMPGVAGGMGGGGCDASWLDFIQASGEAMRHVWAAESVVVTIGDNGMGFYGHAGHPLSLSRSTAKLYGISDRAVVLPSLWAREKLEDRGGYETIDGLVTPNGQVQWLLHRRRERATSKARDAEDATALGMTSTKVRCA